jgi:hypothetical protein
LRDGRHWSAPEQKLGNGWRDAFAGRCPSRPHDRQVFGGAEVDHGRVEEVVAAQDIHRRVMTLELRPASYRDLRLAELIGKVAVDSFEAGGELGNERKAG